MLIFSLQTFSQGEANMWFFGVNAGLNFNTNPVTSILGLSLGHISTEGCATISDSNGNLLFYTNGVNVRNKNHQIMMNGNSMAGSNDSTQSSAIIPYPGTYNSETNCYDKYFLVTLNAYNLPNGNGVSYSEIDMTMDNGLGAVTQNKNIHLFGTRTTEKVCVVPHSNGCDYWVIFQVANSSDFYSYHISNNGFNTEPIISTTTVFATPGSGQLKASPNNKLLSCCVMSGNSPGLYVFNFDNNTGLVTEKFADTTIADIGGTSFSPNSKVLYGSNDKIYQFDMTTTTNDAFVNSKTLIATMGSFSFMQLAPDGKIYITRIQGFTALSAINNPNNLGEDCNFTFNSLVLGGFSMLGLPDHISRLSNEIIIENENCNTLQLALENNYNISNYNWEMSYTTDSQNIISISSEANPIFTIPNQTENYIITCKIESECYSDTFLLSFSPSNLSNTIMPSFVFSTNTYCQNQTPSVLPTTSLEGITGTWSPNTIDTSNIGVSTYVFTPYSGECAYPFTLETTVNPSVNITFSNASICNGETLNFPDTGSISGTWNPATISNTTSKTYTFTPNSPCGLASEWFVEVRNEQPINFAQTTICNGEEINFPNTNAIAGIWSPNTVSNTTSSNYTFTPINNCIQPSTWQVNVVHPATNLSLTTVNNSIVVNTENTIHQLLYQLNNGFTQFSNVFNQVNSGCHTVSVTDSFGCTQLSSTIFVLDYPKFFTPNNDGFNDYWNINLENSNSKLFIFDRYGKLIKQVFPNEIGWNGTYNNKQLPATDYWFVLEYDECGIQKTFKSHFSLLR
jgi:gliding motility-associated-like protein